MLLHYERQLPKIILSPSLSWHTYIRACTHTQLPTSLPHHSLHFILRPWLSPLWPGTLTASQSLLGSMPLSPSLTPLLRGSSHLELRRTHPFFTSLCAKLWWPPFPTPVARSVLSFRFYSWTPRNPFNSSSNATSPKPLSMHFTPPPNITHSLQFASFFADPILFFYFVLHRSGYLTSLLPV